MDGLTLTQELVARAHRMVEDSGPPPGRVPMTDEDYDTSLRQILGALPADDDIWLFAYGSLIWNPACETVERRPAVVPGWHRAFCFTVTRFLGSPDRPGLMMGLTAAASAVGSRTASRAPMHGPSSRSSGGGR
jgi:glutathione-specific gamma-glutamylcyclotransferase